MSFATRVTSPVPVLGWLCFFRPYYLFICAAAISPTNGFVLPIHRICHCRAIPTRHKTAQSRRPGRIGFVSQNASSSRPRQRESARIVTSVTPPSPQIGFVPQTPPPIRDPLTAAAKPHPPDPARSAHSLSRWSTLTAVASVPSPAIHIPAAPRASLPASKSAAPRNRSRGG